MTVSTAYEPVTTTGNGATTAFPTGWPFLTGSLLVTLITTATGAEAVQAISTHYTVAGGTDANGLPATGTVTMLVAPTSAQKLRIERVTPRTQASVYTNNDAFPAKVTESALDKGLLLAQEALYEASRALKVKTANMESGADPALPLLAGAAGKLIAVDAQADGFELVAGLDLDIGTVTTGSPGSQAAAEITGSAPSFVLNLTIPRGDAGAPGAGTGDVVGPVSATDNAVTRFDGTTGKLIQNSGVTISDTNAVAGVASLVVNNDGLKTKDTDGSHNLAISTDSNLTADRTLNLNTGDADRAVTLSGDLTVGGASSINGTAYVAGGTDVAVADGGSGRSSATAYAVVCGGTTSTDPHQSIAGVGTSGQILTSNGAGALPTFQTSGGGAATMPQGRLTLASATPVMTSSVSGGTTVYYTPYMGRHVPIYDGSTYAMTSIGSELSQATSDSTKSPAAVAADSNYDVFVWSDSGTIRATRGPAWTSGTGRGTGAGTTELVRVDGFYLNANAITNGPAAQRGTYVGTIRSNGSSTIDWIFGALAAGGTAARLCVWNCYHRVDVATFVQDSTDTWTYSTQTWRSAQGSATMRVSFVLGLAEDAFGAGYKAYSRNSAVGIPRACGIGYDATNALASGCSPGRAGLSTHAIAGTAVAGEPASEMNAAFAKPGDLGFHFCQAIEISTATVTTTWYGDNGTPTTFAQNGLFFHGRF